MSIPRSAPARFCAPTCALALLAALLGALMTTACTPGSEPAHAPPTAPGDGITAAAIEAHMRFLASDLLEGREAGTRGYDVAAEYVATQFRLLGLRPSGDQGSYFQRVPLQSHWLVKDGTRLVLRAGSRATTLALGQDFVVGSSPLHANSVARAPAVFVGYGIDAPVFTHQDYEGLDVQGKVVVALTGYPTSFPSEEGAHYGSGREKQRTAAAHGAIALIQVYTERFEKVSPWARNVANIDAMQMSWIGPDGMPFVSAPTLQVAGLMSPEQGAALFEGAPRSYADLRAEAATGAPKGFPLAVSIEVAQRSRHERRTSRNVAAILPGSDPTLKAEHVVVLGHLDHEGIATPVGNDSLYNGALDNAAGIAGVLEAARAMTRAKAPKRSVLFLAVTAEEKGLLGSEYFARNSPVPIRAVVAAVNLDMPILLYDFTDVIAFGADHSSLKEVVSAAVSRMGLTVTPDPMPDQALFTRSDHYRFVQQGVPAIFLSTGWNTAAGAGEGGKVFTTFLSEHYHKPSDDLNLPIDYEAGARFARVNYAILREIADADARPTWNEGDFFGGLFTPAR